MKKDSVNFKLLNTGIILLIALLIYLLRGVWMGTIDKILAIIAPFFLAFAVAYALTPIIRKLRAKGLPKGLAVGITFFVGVGTFILLISLLVPLLYKQVLLFLSSISKFISDLSVRFDWNMGDMQTNISGIISDITKSVGSYVSDGAIHLVSQSFGMIATAVIIIFVAIYIAMDMDKFRAYFKDLLKKSKTRSYYYVKVLDHEITNYFTGMGLNMLIQFFEYTFIFFIIGHPNWLILGTLAAVTNIIPYIGGFIVNLFALIIASVISTKLLILTLIVCLICPQLDSYVVGPKVFGKTNNLNPLVNIFAVFAGGMLFGFWGILMSLPIAIIIITTYKFFKKDIDDKITEIKEKV